MSHQDVKTLLGGMSEALKQDPAVLNQFTAKRKLTESMSVISVAFKNGTSEPPVSVLYEHEKARSGREIGKWRAQGLKKRTYSRTETVIQTSALGARTGVWNIYS